MKSNKNKMAKKMRIWIINASPRSENDCPQEKSKSQIIAEYMAKIARKNAEVYLTNLYDAANIGPCKGCVSTVLSLCHYPCDCYPDVDYPNDPMKEFFKIGEKADAIIFVTPVHWWSFSTDLSAFLGRLNCVDVGRPNAKGKDKNFEIKLMNSGKKYPVKHWAGKIAGVYTISESTTGAAEPLAMALNHMGFWIPPHCISEQIIGADIPYHEHNKALDKNYCAWNAAKTIVENVIESVKLVKGKKLKPTDAKCLK